MWECLGVCEGCVVILWFLVCGWGGCFLGACTCCVCRWCFVVGLLVGGLVCVFWVASGFAALGLLLRFVVGRLCWCCAGVLVVSGGWTDFDFAWVVWYRFLRSSVGLGVFWCGYAVVSGLGWSGAFLALSILIWWCSSLRVRLCWCARVFWVILLWA